MAAIGECLRSHLGAGGGQGANRLAVLWRPLAERLVGEVLARPRPMIGDQALYRSLRGQWERVKRLPCLSGGHRLALLAQRRLEHLRVEVVLSPARPL
jgi:hypothetical protein